MNPAVKTIALKIGIGLFVFIVGSFFALVGRVPGLQDPATVVPISVVVSVVFTAFISYGLWRAHRTGVIIPMGRDFRCNAHHRAREPFNYWFWFAFYLLLIPLIFWLMVHGLEALQRRPI
jgi:hypothetical protein